MLRERGQTSAEYVGLILVVAAVIALVATSSIGEAVTTKVTCAIQGMGGGAGCAGTGAAPGKGAPAPGRLPGTPAPEGADSSSPSPLPAGAAAPPAPEDEPSFAERALGTAGDLAEGAWNGAGTVASGAWQGGGALANGFVAGDVGEGYDNPWLEGARSVGQLGSSILVFGDVRDGVNAAGRIVSSGGREGWGDLAWSVGGAVPLIGDVAKGGRLAAGTVDVARNADRARDASRATDEAADAGRGADGGPQRPGAGLSARDQADSQAWREASGGRGASAKLARRLKAAGTERPPGTAAHHIVPANLAKFDSAQRVQAHLRRLGMKDPNDAANGVFLPCRRDCDAPGAYHPRIHTPRYYDELEARMSRATSLPQARQVLARARRDLEADRFPY